MVQAFHAFQGHRGGRGLGQVHEGEAGGVPQLVDEVAVAFDAGFGQADVAAHGGKGRQGEAQGVAAVLVDHLQRVDDVARGLGHLAAGLVTH